VIALRCGCRRQRREPPAPLRHVRHRPGSIATPITRWRRDARRWCDTRGRACRGPKAHGLQAVSARSRSAGSPGGSLTSGDPRP
jgi:hypothetical protein